MKKNKLKVFLEILSLHEETTLVLKEEFGLLL